MAITEAGDVVGVVCVGRPTARELDNGETAEILRVCIIGQHEHAGSFSFARGRDLARALGYRRVITYNLEAESGSSLRAAGFRLVATLPARASCSSGAKRRRGAATNLFGEEQRPTEAKHRWEWP